MEGDKNTCIQWPGVSRTAIRSWEADAQWQAELAAHPVIRKILYGTEQDTIAITWPDVARYAESAFRNAIAGGEGFSPEAYGVTIWLWSRFPQEMEEMGLTNCESIPILHCEIERILGRNGLVIDEEGQGAEPDQETLRSAIFQIYEELDESPWSTRSIKQAVESIRSKIRMTSEKGFLLDSAHYDAKHLGRLARTIHALNYSWWTDLSTGKRLDRNVGELLMLAVSELSEAMEGHRKGLSDDKLPHRQMLEVELADALIRILDMAAGLNLDIAGAVIEKLRYNADRPDHKREARLAEGGKRY